MEAKPVIYRLRKRRELESLDRTAQPIPPSEPVVVRSPIEHPRPTQLPAFRKQEQVDIRAIAHRVRDNTRSDELERLLNKQRNKQAKLPDEIGKLSFRLEHLTIAQRSDQGYQLVLRETQQPFSRYVFETLQYCREAAAELEKTFALEGMLEMMNPEVVEHVDAIVLAAVWRERVALEMAVA